MQEEITYFAITYTFLYKLNYGYHNGLGSFNITVAKNRLSIGSIVYAFSITEDVTKL